MKQVTTLLNHTSTMIPTKVTTTTTIHTKSTQQPLTTMVHHITTAHKSTQIKA